MAGAALALGGVALGITALVAVRGHDPAATRPPPADLPEPSTPDREPVAAGPPAPAAAPAVAAPLAPSAPDRGLVPAAPPVAAPPAAPVPAPTAAPVPAPAVPARPALTVYNNSRIPELGERAAARYRRGGWPVVSVAGLPGRIRATTVYYGPSQRAQAQAVAAAFGIPRVLPRLANLPGSGLTVVVTRDSA